MDGFFYCLTMMAMELVHDGGRLRVAYGDMASKFIEHFVQICDAMNTMGAGGLWDEQDGFYYDQIQLENGESIRLKVKSMVGLLPLISVTALEKETIDRQPSFKKRFEWFKKKQYGTGPAPVPGGDRGHPRTPSLADGHSFQGKADPRLGLHAGRIRISFTLRHSSLSRFHADHPYVFKTGGHEMRVSYAPGESDTGLDGKILRPGRPGLCPGSAGPRWAVHHRRRCGRQDPRVVDARQFRKKFVDSPTMGHMLSVMPVFLMDNQASGLWGAAFYGQQMLRKG